MSQLTAQDLQYIDLVLAGDLMNPIWSFEVGVELEYEIRQPDNNRAWPVLFGQNGADRSKDGIPVLKAPGTIGSEIAAVLRVEDGQGNLIPQKAGYPPVEQVVTLVRVSDNPIDPNFNLFSTVDNARIVLADRPISELKDVPADSILLQDDPEFLVFRTCRTGDGCSAGVVYESLPDNKTEISQLIPIIQARPAFDIGYNCSSRTDFSTCSEIIYDIWDNQDKDSPRENFLIPWDYKGSDLTVAANTFVGGNGHLFRIRIPGMEHAQSWLEEGSMLHFGMPGQGGINASRQYLQPDGTPFDEKERVIGAPTLSSSVMFLTDENISAESQNTVVVGNSNTTVLVVDSYKPATAGQPYMIYTFTGHNEIPQDYCGYSCQPRHGGFAENAGYFLEFFIEMSFLQEKIPLAPVQQDIAIPGRYSQTRRAAAVQEYHDHRLFSSHGDLNPINYPKISQLQAVQATLHYSENGECDFDDDETQGHDHISNCIRAVAANYNDSDLPDQVGTDPFTFGKPLLIGETARNYYNGQRPNGLINPDTDPDSNGPEQNYSVQLHDDFQVIEPGKECPSSNSIVIWPGPGYDPSNLAAPLHTAYSGDGAHSRVNFLTSPVIGTDRLGSRTVDSRTVRVVECGPEPEPYDVNEHGGDTRPMEPCGSDPNRTVARPYCPSADTSAYNEAGNSPIDLTSIWRNPERNEKVGGVINSRHQFGGSVDIKPRRIQLQPGVFVEPVEQFCFLEMVVEQMLVDHYGLSQAESRVNAISENGTTQLHCDSNQLSHLHIEVF